jgi:ferredoxin
MLTRAYAKRDLAWADTYLNYGSCATKIVGVTYVIAEPCLGKKDASCTEVCPVDCIHPTTDESDFAQAAQLYIDPDECIDCDACVEACPFDATFAEDQLPETWAHYAAINRDYYAQASA